MKTLMRFLVLFVVLSLVLVACAPVARPLMQLPDEGRELVIFLVTAALTWVLLKAGELLKVNLSGYIQPAAAVIAPVIITVIEHYLQMIPSIYDNLALTLIHLVVLLIGSVGTFLIVQRFKTKDAKALLA